MAWHGGHPWLQLSMRDNGPGLPFEIIDKLFEPWRTFGIVNAVQAIGLGDSVGQNVHTIGLVVEHLARFFSRLHIAGCI